jgi:hydroxyethylthiazole kinase-like uncharacterized protein yjeF
MKLVTVKEMRAIEKAANQAGLSYAEMMERAGKGLAKWIQADFEGGKSHLAAMALVGSGNNGGDALVALTALAQAGWQTLVYLAADRPENDPLLRPFDPADVVKSSADPEFRKLKDWLETVDVVLDGVLGTGARLPLSPELGAVLGFVSTWPDLPYVIAVDCPSGVNCETGEASPETIAADLTVCMQAVKTGLLRFPAYEKVGGLEVVDLGLPDGLQEWQQVQLEVADEDRVLGLLPDRPLAAHKGTFGTALVVAGSINYTGAAYLASRAAYLVGVGLVQAAVPGPLHAVLAGQLPEVTWLLLPHQQGVVAESAAEVIFGNLARATAVLVGPGLGMEDTSGAFIKKLLEGMPSASRRSGFGFLGSAGGPPIQLEKTRLPPLILDADGLKLLAKQAEWWKLLPPETILTPHPGEMAVLTGMETSQIQAERLDIARKFAAEWGQVVVLKGALTVVAAPDGRAVIIPVANAALARAGTGDVLAGMITGLRAQGLAAYEAALVGTFLHAQAGLEALVEVGAAASVLAGDVLEAIPAVLQSLGA